MTLDTGLDDPRLDTLALQMSCNHVHDVHIMRTVNTTELRRRLSAYLGRVRGGEEILIRALRANMAVAKIVPISKIGDFDGEMLELAALGQLQLPGRSLDLTSFSALSAPKTVADKLRAAIEEEREED